MEKELKVAILLTIIWRAILFIVVAVSAFFMRISYNFTGVGFSDSPAGSRLWQWANFDGEHYLSIVTRGYGQFEYAFFPGYPLVTAFLMNFIYDPLAASLLISNICLIISVILLFRLWSLNQNKTTVLKAIGLFLVYPASFYLGASYTESLFLCLSVGAFLAAEKKNYLLGGLLVFFASVTRLVGIFLIPALFLLWMSNSKKKTDLLPLILAVAGFLSVSLFNYLQTGDALYFFHVQPLFGAERTGGGIVFFPQIFYRYLKIFMTANPLALNYFVSVQEALVVVLAALLLIKGRKLVRFAYILYSAAVLITPTLTGTFSSMPRYSLAAFPLFLIGAKLLKNNLVFWLVALGMIILQIIDVILFSNGYWVS